MPLNRRILYFPAVTLTALTVTLTVILAISTYRNLHREQAQMEESLLREGIVLSRQFETVVHNYSNSFTEEVAQVQQLATVSAPNDDIAYLYLFNQQGTILAHTDAQRIGRQIDGRIPQGEEVLKFRQDSATEHILEVRSPFHSVSSEKPAQEHETGNIDHYLGIGLKMTALEQIHTKDRKHTMMMAAMLILLGSGSLFFILVVQNFYLIQRTLNQMKSYIHYVVESMASGLISLDADGVVTTINPAAAELIGASDAKNLSVRTLFDEHADEINAVLQNDSPILNKEIVYHQPDGGRIPVSLSATQVKDSDGNNLGAVILLQDLRELKALQERAKRAEHLASIGRMAATVAHEIRNPLSSIRGFAQYFRALFPAEKEEHAYAQAMIEESNRLNRVVSELLAYARPLVLNLKPHAVETLFEDTVRMSGVEKEAKAIEIAQEFEAGMPPVQLDRDRMIQVLLNLIQNSMDAMPNGGKLVLKATSLAEMQGVQIIVEDTGSGIPESDQARLFEPFFTTKARGTGLGLAVVRKIVDAHRGTVEVQSETGKGTTVVLTFPQAGKVKKEEAYHATEDTYR